MLTLLCHLRFALLARFSNRLFDPAEQDVFGDSTDLQPPPSPIRTNVMENRRQIGATKKADSHRARLVQFYTSNNPAKLEQVDHILAQWQGQEAEMFICLEQKYGIDMHMSCNSSES